MKVTNFRQRPIMFMLVFLIAFGTLSTFAFADERGDEAERVFVGEEVMVTYDASRTLSLTTSVLNPRPGCRIAMTDMMCNERAGCGEDRFRLT